MGGALDPDLLVRLVRGQDVAGDPPRLLGGVGEVEGGPLDLAPRLGDGLALLHGDEPGEGFPVAFDQGGEPAEMVGTTDRRQGLPVGLGTGRGLGGQSGLGGAAGRHSGKDLAGSRILHLDPAGAFQPSAVDAMAIVLQAVLLGEHVLGSGQPG